MGKSCPLRLFIAYHKPAWLLKNSICVPVHAGRAVANIRSKDGSLSDADRDWLSRMPGDDTGDNISSLNRYFSENTMHYWVWKNYAALGDPEYVGFMQYRRNFLFNEYFVAPPHRQIPRGDRVAVVERPWPDYLEETLGSEEYACEVAASCDVIATTPVSMSVSVYEEYLRQLPHNFDVDPHTLHLMTEEVKRRYPAYVPAMDRYLNGRLHYWFHTYIMQREHYADYMEWLFSIMMAMHERMDYSRYSVAGARVMGYVIERLHGIYITHVLDQKTARVGWLPLTFLVNTDLNQR